MKSANMKRKKKNQTTKTKPVYSWLNLQIFKTTVRN